MTSGRIKLFGGRLLRRTGAIATHDDCCCPCAQATPGATVTIQSGCPAHMYICHDAAGHYTFDYFEIGDGSNRWIKHCHWCLTHDTEPDYCVHLSYWYTEFDGYPAYRWDVCVSWKQISVAAYTCQNAPNTICNAGQIEGTEELEGHVVAVTWGECQWCTANLTWE